MSKKRSSLLLTLCVLLCAFVFAISANADNADTAVYEVESADDFLTLMNDSSLWASDIILTKDIDLGDATNGLEQSPIGSSSSKKFTGTFDGQGYTISGFNMVAEADDINYWAPFGYCGGVVIKNLTTEGVINGQANTGSTAYTAGIVAIMTSGDRANQIINCTNYCTITGSKNTGGIVGLNGSGTDTLISGCKNYGAISSNDQHVAGVVGYIYVTSSASATVENCYNGANVSTTHTDSNQIGGIVGGIDTTTAGARTYLVSNCLNDGNVQGDGNSVAGIVGFIRARSDDSITVSDCMNTGTITGASATNTGAIADCTTDGKPVVSRVYNSGEILIGTASEGYRLFGRSSNVTLTAAYTADDTDLSGLDSDAWIFDLNGKPELLTFHETHVATENYATVGAQGHVPACYCGEAYDADATPVAHTDADTDGYCDICGGTLCAHATTTLVTDTAATCLATGLGHTVCDDCGETIEENVLIEIDENNHEKETVSSIFDEDNGCLTFVYDCCGNVLYEDWAISTDIYVASTGTVINSSSVLNDGFGITDADPFGDFEQAMQYAAVSAGVNGEATIHIIDSTGFEGTYETPTFDGTITITGGTFNFGGSSRLFAMNGDMVFENINLTASSNAGAYLYAQNNKLVLGSGITSGSLDTAASDYYKFYIVGGYYGSGDQTVNSDLTVRSGTYNAVVGGDRVASLTLSGSPKVTVGALGDDTLTINMLTPFSMSGGDLSEDSTATVIIDGDVSVTTLYPSITTYGSHIGDQYVYTTNLVIKGDLTVSDFKNQATSAVTVFNVYADGRVDTAADDAAFFTNKGDNLTVNQYTYAYYCNKYIGHTDANTDGACDECGCAHADTNDVVITPATCSNTGVAYATCTECGYAVGEIELPLDATVHESTSIWTKNDETGKYLLVCSGCGESFSEQDVAPVIYVGADGDDTASGADADNKLATLTEAVERIAACGGTIAISGGVTLSDDVILPEWNGTIKFTSATLDENGEAIDGFTIASESMEITLGGDAIFDAVLFKGTSSKVNLFVLNAMWHNVDFKYVKAETYAKVYVVAGEYGISESDDAEVTSTINIDAPVLGTNADEYFYARVYLGSVFVANGLDAANKTLTLNVYDGYANANATERTLATTINTVYSMSTTANEKYAESVTTNCESTINLYGGTTINYIRSGDKNVFYDEQKDADGNITRLAAGASLDKLTLNFFGNSQIGTNCQIKNVVECVIYVSNEADGRTAPLTQPISFYKYGTFVDTEATVAAAYGTHSFDASITDAIVESGRTNDIYPYTVTENVTDECTWDDGEITTEATPDAAGVKTYTCADCGRTKTEEVPYACTVHVYVAKADGTYYCTNGCENIVAPTAPVIIAAAPATAENGVATVDISVKATTAFTGTRFKIDAPEGFTLTAAESAFDAAGENSTGFTIISEDTVAVPYNVALIHMSAIDSTMDQVVLTLTFSVADAVEDGTYVITVEAVETYNAAEEEIETLSVSAEVTLATEVHTHVYANWTDNEDGTHTGTCECGETSTEAHGTLTEKTAAKAPTCTAVGATAVMGCEKCDYTEGGEEIKATGHVDVKTETTAPTREADAVKTVTCACGEVVSTETIAPADMTVTFQHNVRFQAEYFLLFAARHTDLANTTDRWAEFKTYNYDDSGNPVINVTIVDPDTATAAMKTFISPGISAKQMNDKVEMTYYCIADGVKYKSQVDTYNLVDYYLTQQGNGTDLENLLIAMLNYGAAAQKQMDNYNVTEVEGDRYTGLVNKHLPAEQQKNDLDAYADITTSVARNPHGDTADMTYAFQANNGRFKQRISVLYAFRLLSGKTEYAMEDLVFKGTYTGLDDETNKEYVTKTIEIKGSEGGFEKSGSMLVVVVDQISVKDLRATIVDGAIYDLEGNRVSETIDSGFECYVHGASNASEAMQLLMKATLSYSDAAKIYFMNK